MPSSVKSHPVRRLTADALLLCVALMLSYLEALLPIVPLPGVRLGLAQSVVTIAYFRLGRADAAASERMTARICDLFERKLGISPDRVYVKYEEAEHWGWNGANF